MYKKIKLNDSGIQDAINNELIRQNDHIELIASENFVSEDVLKATGSVLTNKYVEGYPGSRYYSGCENIDTVETLAKDRLKKLFNVKYVNVQPHSGSSANAAAIAAVIKPGEKILGMGLSSGGHLTHGFRINFSGIFYDAHNYEVDKNGLIDYDEVLQVAKKIKPALIICGFTAYSRKYDFAKFREIADEVGAVLLADIAHVSGLVIAGLHPSPVGHAHIITSTSHKTLRGARGGFIMTNDLEIFKRINCAVFPGYQGGALAHSIAGKAVSFHEALQPFFQKYQEQLLKNSIAFANKFMELGVKIITDGTDNHLFIIDVKSSYDKTGKETAAILHKNKITCNMNTIPYDTQSSMVTSGIRLGTAAMTSRGFVEQDFEELSEIIHGTINGKLNQKQALARVKTLIVNNPIKKSFYNE